MYTLTILHAKIHQIYLAQWFQSRRRFKKLLTYRRQTTNAGHLEIQQARICMICYDISLYYCYISETKHKVIFVFKVSVITLQGT